MTQLSTAALTFLGPLGWASAPASVVAGDLSSRLYFRLNRGDATALLVEDPSSASRQGFVTIANWLSGIGLSAPAILAEDQNAGLLLIEDFGDAKLTGLIGENPGAQKGYYKTAVDVLLHIRDQPALLLPAPNATALLEDTTVADTWYPQADRSALDELRTCLGPLLEELLEAPRTVSLRDFHADNIIWLAERSGISKLGLLDFQDAFLMHPTYDLMSLLTDARVDVPVEVWNATLSDYAEKSGVAVNTLSREVAILGVQRNLRIMGIFWRAARRDGKDHHLSALPRVRSKLAHCLGHPVFKAIGGVLGEALPMPEGSVP